MSQEKKEDPAPNSSLGRIVTRKCAHCDSTEAIFLGERLLGESLLNMGEGEILGTRVLTFQCTSCQKIQELEM